MVVVKRYEKLYTLNRNKPYFYEIIVFRRSGYGAYSVSQGYIGGKVKQSLGKEFVAGKQNRTPVEQALLVADKLYNDKLKQGYVINIDNIYKSTVSPMLAKEYTKNEKHISFPCIVQPKLDGVRALIYLNEERDDVYIMSRNNNRYFLTKEIHEELVNIFHNNNILNYVLDGELYSHTYNFNTISGLVRQSEKNRNNEEFNKKIEFHMFDLISDNDLIFEERDKIRLNLSMVGEYVKLVESIYCQDRSKICNLHDNFVNEGYEGIMLKNLKGKYVGNRSNDVQKYKIFYDKEFVYEGFNEGTGKFKGTPILICSLVDNEQTTFKVTPKGDMEFKKKLFLQLRKDDNQYKGKLYTVKYQTLDHVSGIPRFPVGIGFRNYE